MIKDKVLQTKFPSHLHQEELFFNKATLLDLYSHIPAIRRIDFNLNSLWKADSFGRFSPQSFIFKICSQISGLCMLIWQNPNPPACQSLWWTQFSNITIAVPKETARKGSLLDLRTDLLSEWEIVYVSQRVRRV